MFAHPRRSMGFAALVAGLTLPHAAAAQVSTFQACSPGALSNCATVRLTSQLGVGPGSTNLFEIALQNLGSQSAPSLATSLYFLALRTGQSPAIEIDTLVTPTSVGGATISDPAGWSIAESGDAIFLSAAGNDGIGGCAASSSVGGFGQMAQTCGASDFVTFSFFTSRAFDVDAITLADMEFVAVANGNATDSCNDSTPCVVTPVTTTPEPGSMMLALTGLTGIAGVRLRRRSASANRATLLTREA
jgi:MYXO-CTERM domain-containing protein